MDRVIYITAIVLTVPVLSFVFWAVTFPEEADRTFLTVSTFLFTIFTSFFISRQANRFNRVRESVTAFDGQLSSIYRLSGHVSEAMQQAVGTVLQAHYDRIFTTGQWNIHMHERSQTLQHLHTILDEHVKEEAVTKLQNQALGAIIKGLAACQKIRKQQVALFAERVPLEQWVLIIFFAAMLITTVSTLAVDDFTLGAILKAAFVVSVFAVLYILYKLNSLSFSEKLMGEHSAQDVLDIIAQKR